MDEKLYSSLVILFEIDMDAAMRECERLLIEDKYSSFAEFVAHHTQSQECRVCQQSWGNSSLAGHCLDCQEMDHSCVCIPCFLAGNHANHRSYLIAEGSGNCDCGDKTFWKESGFCPKHPGPGPNPDITGLPDSLRTLLITIFTASLNNFGYLAIHDVRGFADLLNWYEVFIPIGDAMRRCFAIAARSLLTRSDFALILASMPLENMEKTIECFGRIVNDEEFAKSFGVAIIKSYPKWIWMMMKALRDESSTKESMSLFTTTFLFHAFSTSAIRGLLESNWDWVSSFNEILAVIIGTYRREPSEAYVTDAMLSLHITHLDVFVKVAGTMEEQKENIVRCAECFAEQLAGIEGFLPFTIEVEAKKNSHIMEYSAQNTIGYVLAVLAETFCKLNAFSEKIVRTLFGSVLEPLIIENGMDAKTATGDVVSRCPLDPNVRVSPQIQLSVFAADVLLRQKENVVPILNKICGELGVSVDDMCEYWQTMISRWIASICLDWNGFFLRNTDDLRVCFASFHYRRSAELRSVPVFAAVQLCYGASKPKNRFLSNMARIFGVIPRREQWTSFMDFGFLHFVGCLVFDRYAITRDVKNIRRSQALVLLQKGPMLMSEIVEELGLTPSEGLEFPNDLMECTTRDSTTNGALFRVATSRWNVFVPYVYLSSVVDAIAAINSKNPDSLLFVPEVSNDIYGLDLQSGLCVPVVFAIEWYVIFLYGTEKDKFDMPFRLALTLMIAASNISPQPTQAPKQTSVRTLEELTERLPSNFFEFLKTPVKYQDNEPVSAFEMLQTCGRIGHDALSRMNIGYEPPKPSQEVIRKDKARIAALKSAILAKFDEQKAIYGDVLGKTPVASEDVCCVCKDSGGEKGYPCMIFCASLARHVCPEYDEKGAVAINVCPHLIHYKCAPKRSFLCSVDRKWRNGILPQVNREPSEKTMKILQNFVHATFNDKLERVAATLCTELGMLELQHRFWPKTLDRTSNRIILRNLFHLIWIWKHKFHTELAFEDPLASFVVKLAESEDPEKDFATLVGTFGTEFSTLTLFEFLRRVAILEHFAFNTTESDGGHIDWDSILSFPSLLDRYHIDGVAKQELDLPSFQFQVLPDSYLMFLMPPYQFEILDTASGIAVCLVSGTVVCLKRSKGHPNIWEYLEKNCKNGASMFLVLTGRYATSVIVCSAEFHKKIPARPIYLDPCGEADVGLRNGRVLRLNMDRYYQAQEFFLSGEWISHLSRKP